MKRITNKVFRASRSLGLLLVLCLIFGPALLQAGEFGEHEVRTAVETWVRYVTADARPDAFIEMMEPYKIQGKTVAYIAHLMGGGFCLCGADDLVLPVYLYSPKGTYNPQNTNYQYILWEIGARLKYVQKGLEEREPKLQLYQEALSQREAFWQDLIAGIAPRKMEQPEALFAEPEKMEIPLTCEWHQYDPFNDQCPVLTPPDDHCLVGCAATATAQIMYYWKWPNTGVGSANVDYNYQWTTVWIEEPLAKDPQIDAWFWGSRLEWTSAGGGKLRINGYWDASVYNKAKNISGDPDYLAALSTLMTKLNTSWHTCTANFGATSYNWSIMTDTNALPPGPGDAEMAKLCYHVGIAAETDYGVFWSGAFLWDNGSASHRCAVDALENYFRYDEDADYRGKSIEEMIEEIQWLRPLLFGGEDASGNGHGWVVYGYNKGTDEFKMNMGDGYPGEWYTCDKVYYPYEQFFIRHIAPEDVVRFVGSDYYPGNGSPDSPHKDIDEALLKAPDGATLIFKAGSDNTFSTGIINRPLTLKGKDVIIRKQ